MADRHPFYMVWSGALNFGDTPGVFTNAQFVGLLVQLPVTLTFVPDDNLRIRFLLQTTDVEIFNDKTHPVLFGEAVPFRFGRLRFLYLWLNGLSPFGAGGFEYSLTAGEEVGIFDMTTAGENGRSYRFGTPICYEDVMPYVIRRFVWDREKSVKRVDFLLNISNDGWFQHLSELPQHFAICTFRAVENRVGIARTVNTGISGFIDPNGRAYEKMAVGEIGVRVAAVMTDTRVSLYSRTGNVFALCCAAAWCLLCIDYIVVRARSGNIVEGTTGT